MEKKIKIPDMSLPDISIDYKVEKDKSTGKKKHLLKVSGFRGYEFVDAAKQEYIKIKSIYYELAMEDKIKPDHIKIFKKQLELWAREKINGGEIVRYLSE